MIFVSSLGLKTALVEKYDYASGTSSRSTKLIHGGVRYLQKAIMNLDREQVRIKQSFTVLLTEVLKKQLLIAVFLVSDGFPSQKSIKKVLSVSKHSKNQRNLKNLA